MPRLKLSRIDPAKGCLCPACLAARLERQDHFSDLDRFERLSSS
jgi:hypothetical protein